MARIRTIKPSFFRHRDLFLLEQSTGLPIRVAFAGLWTVADREGRFRWRVDELKLDCLPYDPVDFAAVLAALARGGFVAHYQVAGRCYGVIPSFTEHQIINSREARSALPAPDEADIAITCNCNVERERERERERKGKGKGNGKGNGDSFEPLHDSKPANATQAARMLREGDTTQEPGGTHDSATHKGGGSLVRSGALVRSQPEVRARAEDGPVILTFPTIGTGGAEWRLSRAQLDEWQALFPALDVLAECRHALAWVKAHPDRRKTVRGMPKFLTGWFTRSVNRRRGNAHSTLHGESKLTLALRQASDW